MPPDTRAAPLAARRHEIQRILRRRRALRVVEEYAVGFDPQRPYSTAVAPLDALARPCRSDISRAPSTRGTDEVIRAAACVPGYLELHGISAEKVWWRWDATLGSAISPEQVDAARLSARAIDVLEP